MAEKIEKVKSKKATAIEELFEEAQEEINEETVKAAKIKIKDLLNQRTKAQKVVANLDRQIDDLKLQISQDLGV